MFRKPALTLLVMSCTVAVLAGCGSSSKTASPTTSAAPNLSGSITVLAASSLSGTFTQIGKQFEAAHPGTTVKFSFGASSTLAQQIVAGAPTDVFASASTKDMATVTAANDATNPVNFATNTAEIAVAPSSASKVSSIGDLADSSTKVALCQPQVPCGVLATTVLGKANVTVKPVTQGLDVKSTLAYVTSGQADAAIVYVTDVKAAGTTVTGVTIPGDDNSTTSYPIAPLRASTNSTLAAAFTHYVLSADGQSVLTAAGFQKG